MKPIITLLLLCMHVMPTMAKDAEMIPRSEWTSIPRDTKKLKEHTQGITDIVLHHSGAAVHLKGDPKSRIDNSIRSWHMEAKGGGGWGDVAYHFIIDQNGKIYEGRPEKYQGGSFTPYSLDRKLLICVLGDYRTVQERKIDLKLSLGKKTLTKEEEQKIEAEAVEFGTTLSAKAQAAIVLLVVQKAKQWQVTIDHIKTHRQLAQSSCPGDNYQTWFSKFGLPQIQAELK